MEPVIPSTKISELFNITGKVVLIVGAGGMGRVIAKAFADNGARIAVATRSQSSLDITRDLLAESGAEQRYYIMHVENKAEVEEVEEIVDALTYASHHDIVLQRVPEDDKKDENHLQTVPVGVAPRVSAGFCHTIYLRCKSIQKKRITSPLDKEFFCRLFTKRKNKDDKKGKILFPIRKM